jgi:hypothetical protein
MRPEMRSLLAGVLVCQAGCGGAGGPGSGAQFTDDAPVLGTDGHDDAGAVTEPDEPSSGGAGRDGSVDIVEPDAADIRETDGGDENEGEVDADREPVDAGYGALPDGGALDPATLPYARSIVRYAPGPNAGFGQDELPAVVLGPPVGKGVERGSLDVLSLGVGGEIVLDFGERAIVDGEGPDFVVFENAFWPGGDASKVFAELGEVAVSDDGSTWLVFPCDTTVTAAARYPGCAGWTPTRDYDPFALVPLDPALSGGDAFDLAALGVLRARFVRVRDLSTAGSGSTAGFDLDAIGVIHAEEPGAEPDPQS